MNKNGFTLIELLAVIIILGILMIIAIPSVTKYISDSRKSAYIDTAKEIVGGTRNVVNEGKLKMYDTTTTYYIPFDYIKTENANKSPYGEFTQAYVGVIYDGQSYNYYWISVDDAGEGVDKVTPVDKLDIDDIKSDLNSDDIENTVKTTGIGDRPNIKILKPDGTWDDYNADDNVGEDGSSNSSGYTGYAYLYNVSGGADIGAKLDNERVTVWCNVTEDGRDNGQCLYYNGYSSEQECLDYMQQNGSDYYSRCVLKERLTDSNLLFYEINEIPYEPYFVKMRIKNDILVSAWGCFYINNQEYCLIGTDEGASYSDNINILRSVQSYFSNCDFGDDYSSCYGGSSSGLSTVSVGMDGVVLGNSYEAQCFINNLYIGCVE